MMQTLYFDDATRTIEQIIIRLGPTVSDTYRGLLFDALQVVMPGGRLLGVLLEREGGLAEDRSGRLLLSRKVEGSDVVCELDPEHGFPPKSLEVRRSGAVKRIAVDSTAAGALFPRPETLSGVVEFEADGMRSVVETRTRIEEFVSNQIMPNSFFEYGKPQLGVLVDDRIKGTQTIQGGLLARTELIDAHPPRRTEPAVDPAESPIIEPIRAAVDPPRSPLAPILAGAGVATGCLAVVLRIARSGSAEKRPDGDG